MQGAIKSLGPSLDKPATGDASDHLRTVHGEKSSKTLAEEAKRTRPAQQTLRSRAAKAAKQLLAGNAMLFGLRPERERPGQDEEDEEEESSYDEAKRLVDEYRAWCASNCSGWAAKETFFTTFPHSQVHRWWGTAAKKELDSRVYAIMSVVARAVLALTGGSGMLERDFCDVPSIMTAKRAGLSPSVAEMILLAHAWQKIRSLLPDMIKELTAEEAQAAMPARMGHAGLSATLMDLFENMSDEDAFETSAVEDMAPWVGVAELAQAWADFE